MPCRLRSFLRCGWIRCGGPPARKWCCSVKGLVLPDKPATESALASMLLPWPCGPTVRSSSMCLPTRKLDQLLSRIVDRIGPWEPLLCCFRRPPEFLLAAVPSGHYSELAGSILDHMPRADPLRSTLPTSILGTIVLRSAACLR